MRLSRLFPWLSLIATCAALIAAPAAGRSLYQKQFDNNHELEVEFDSYYSNIDYYIPLTDKPIPCVTERNEFKIYRELLLHPLPRFLVFEASVNPMPCLGVYIRRNHPDLYQRAQVTNNLNLVQTVTAGFEDPYAYSVLWANVVSFRPKGSNDCDGKGYIGVLMSIGDYHIKDNELIDDRWFEAEMKFKGDRLWPENKMSWSFRVGTRHHGNQYIKDVFYMAVRRDRVDVNDYSLSLLRNSGYEYTIDIDKDTGQAIRHYFRIGKKMPLRNSHIAFSLNTGFIWEGQEKYLGPLRRTTKADDFQIMIQPNIEF